MREQATSQLRLAIEAFMSRDPKWAAALRDMDDVMDDLQKELLRAIFAMRADDENAIQRAVQTALVGRYFERIADHAVNIGERVDFVVSGHFHEHPPMRAVERRGLGGAGRPPPQGPSENQQREQENDATRHVGDG
jgi:phosphate transport system protein